MGVSVFGEPGPVIIGAAYLGIVAGEVLLPLELAVAECPPWRGNESDKYVGLETDSTFKHAYSSGEPPHRGRRSSTSTSSAQKRDAPHATIPNHVALAISSSDSSHTRATGKDSLSVTAIARSASPSSNKADKPTGGGKPTTRPASRCQQQHGDRELTENCRAILQDNVHSLLAQGENSCEFLNRKPPQPGVPRAPQRLPHRAVAGPCRPRPEQAQGCHRRHAGGHRVSRETPPRPTRSAEVWSMFRRYSGLKRSPCRKKWCCGRKSSLRLLK